MICQVFVAVFCGWVLGGGVWGSLGGWIVWGGGVALLATVGMVCVLVGGSKFRKQIQDTQVTRGRYEFIRHFLSYEKTESTIQTINLGHPLIWDTHIIILWVSRNFCRIQFDIISALPYNIPEFAISQDYERIFITAIATYD